MGYISNNSFRDSAGDPSRLGANSSGALNSVFPGDQSSRLSACSSKYSGSVVTRRRSVMPGANRLQFDEITTRHGYSGYLPSHTLDSLFFFSRRINELAIAMRNSVANLLQMPC